MAKATVVLSGSKSHTRSPPCSLREGFAQEEGLKLSQGVHKEARGQLQDQEGKSRPRGKEEEERGLA